MTQIQQFHNPLFNSSSMSSNPPAASHAAAGGSGTSGSSSSSSSSSIPIPVVARSLLSGSIVGSSGGSSGLLSGSFVGHSMMSMTGTSPYAASPRFTAVGTPKGRGMLPGFQLSPMMLAGGIFSGGGTSGNGSASAGVGGGIVAGSLPTASASSSAAAAAAALSSAAPSSSLPPFPAPVAVPPLSTPGGGGSALHSRESSSASVPVTPAAAGSNGGGGLHITTSQGIFSPTGISVLTGGAFGAPTPQSSTPAAAPQLPAPPPSLPPPLHPLHTTSPPPVLLPVAAPGTGAGTDASTRKTRIICTLGPASGSPEMLQGLLRAGMNVARFNFSHGTHADHADMLARLRAAEAATGLHCCYLLDTKGPEIRTGRLQHKTLELKAGQTLLLRTDLSLEEHTTTFLGSASEGVSVDYPRLGAVLRPGSVVKIDDGLIVTRVIEVLQPENGSGGITGVRVRVDNNAVLGERKGVNLPGTLVDLPAVTARDRADLRFGVEQGFHLVAASFMRSADAVRELKQYLLDDQIAVARARNQPQEPPVHVIAKIENQQGLDAFDEILEASDGIMVARGDLGVEIPIQLVSTAQKRMIRKCNQRGKPVITATQMLESMIVNPRPTRAEASDVTNAVLDGSDCVMLSGETAKGAYPLESVRTMARICTTAESATDYQQLHAQLVWQANSCGTGGGRSNATVQPVSPHTATQATGAAAATVAVVPRRLRSKAESIAASAVHSAMDLGAAAIVVHSDSGNAARYVCKYRPQAPVILLTTNRYTHAQARIVRGLWSVLVERAPGSAGAVPSAVVASPAPSHSERADSAGSTCSTISTSSSSSTAITVSASALLATALAYARARGWVAPPPVGGASGGGGGAESALTAAAAPQVLVLVSGNQIGVAGAAHTMRIIDV